MKETDTRLIPLILSGQATESQMELLGPERVTEIKMGKDAMNMRDFATEDYEVKQVGERRFAFSFSNEKPDQAGDILKASGWDLSVHKRNPAVLWSHDGRSRPPVGTVAKIQKGIDVAGAKGLAGDIQLAPEGTSDFTDALFRFVEAKIVRATSVGFKFLETKRIEDADERLRLGIGPFGVFSLRHLLFEVSLVSIGMNSDALAREAEGLLSKGLVTKAGVDEILKTMPMTERDYARVVGDLCKDVYPSVCVDGLTYAVEASKGVYPGGWVSPAEPITLGSTSSGTHLPYFQEWKEADYQRENRLLNAENVDLKARLDKTYALCEKQADAIGQMANTMEALGSEASADERPVEGVADERVSVEGELTKEQLEALIRKAGDKLAARVLGTATDQE